VKQGEVWMTDFGSPSGPEQAGIRPAVIVQDDVLNGSLPTMVVVPLTTKPRRLDLPSTILLFAGEAGLPRDSVALCHQIQVRGKVRLLAKLGELEPARFQEVQEGVLSALGM
jgi:mRNA interferase MazF